MGEALGTAAEAVGACLLWLVSDETIIICIPKHRLIDTFIASYLLVICPVRPSSGLLDNVSHVTLNGDEQNRYAGNLNFSFAYVEGESLLMVGRGHIPA